MTRAYEEPRESSKILAASGISRQQSRRVLLAGLAGPGLRAGSALLYDQDEVRRVACQTPIDHQVLADACPGGVLVVRQAPGSEPDVAWAWTRRAEMVRSQPFLSLPAWLQVVAQISVHGRLACVATVCGYPVLTADLLSFRHGKNGRVELGLEEPGAWSSLLHERRLVTSAGPPWLVLGAQPYLGRAARERARTANGARASVSTRWG